ncbi:MAG: hypothetical protein JXA21_22400 [Anaerolineae bacterium]|nr:hypothetical protein [Anaerolineae bacterium]
MQPETSQTLPKDPTKQAPTQSTPAEGASPETPQSATKSAKRAQFLYITIAVVILGLFITFIVFMATHAEATANIRDIAIVFVAIETSIIGLAAIMLIFQIQMLIQVLRDEIQPLLQSFSDTASTVRGTTEFVSQNMVSPIIKAAGFAAGVQRVTGDVFAIAKNLRPRSKSARRADFAPQNDTK